MKKIIISLIAISLIGASCSFNNTAKVGIVKTANGGVDWQPANKIVNNDKSLLEQSISQVKFNNNADKIFASSFDGGLYSSEDAGENWTELLGGVVIYDFAFNPNDDNIIYAASFMGDRGRLIATKDGGKSWTEVFSDADTQNPVRSVAVNPNNPADIVIGLAKGSLIESMDSGTSWRLLQNYNDRINRIYWQNQDMYVIVKQTGLFKSSDGGASFQLVSKNLATPQNRSADYIFGSQINDYRQLGIDQMDPNSLWLTTNKGLFHSTNGGSNWNFVSIPFGQTQSSPFAVSVAPNSGSVIYVSSSATIYKSVDGGVNWSASDTNTNGLVTSILISRDLPQLAFAGVSK